ncbi:hypothetical protein CLAFUW4_07826 [Fulvia fulva]|uniref:Uncharacterized protein n=1 Tax=Passalora fulva TaxID=5499 RepID=A0A9Q8P6Z2_PASFU|nr:uncharacterized protein CLAFUR5_07950 [Fulvia fulva]KAK4629075.1 hypothetical protein CLAFUR4_07831 [Fulvia fulva]KAK4629922.1 hypothetical protein CLAFUR0_07828 [Fulvia fulva]UJO15523.1 hypothetical protein CLAFUR5_07950 [Fulvia fulva]WPV12729.1 hypothetical protein CLAFUW4_07826 [Fulvia fulva]WPV27079.1 hypothetical protein CLAFUW7_07827 [Fulvia fulva]
MSHTSNKMSFATPLSPAYSRSYSSAIKSYQPFSSSSSKSSKKSTTTTSSSSKRSKWSRKHKKEDMSDYGRLSGGACAYDEKSLSSSSRNSNDPSSSATSTRTTSTTESASREASSSATGKSNKSSRSWFKRVFVGPSDAELDEDPEAMRRERNAMWRNMSMGYENQDLPVALPMFIWYLDPPNLIIATQCLF